MTRADLLSAQKRVAPVSDCGGLSWRARARGACERVSNALSSCSRASSERFGGADWVLPDFGDYMLSRCPAPYGFGDYSGAGLDYPASLTPTANATAGRW